MMHKITAEEVKQMRDDTGEAMSTCKRILQFKYLRNAIRDLGYTSVEQKEVLMALVDLVENKHPADALRADRNY